MPNINYVAAATALDPDVSISLYADIYDYDSIAWTGTPIDRGILDSTWLELEKQRQINTISEEMHTEVTGGFLSDALVENVFLKYDSDIQGQVAIIGALVYLTPHEDVIPPTTFTLSSVDPVTGIRGYAAYNYSQIYRLLTDIGIFSTNDITKLQIKIGLIRSVDTGNVSNDLDAIYGITWVSVD